MDSWLVWMDTTADGAMLDHQHRFTSDLMYETDNNRDSCHSFHTSLLLLPRVI